MPFAFSLVSPEDISSESSAEPDDNKGVAISSPIRVTPDRKVEREGKKGSLSKWRGEKGRSSATPGSSNKLSVKERLFVSRKTIGEQKRNRVCVCGRWDVGCISLQWNPSHQCRHPINYHARHFSLSQCVQYKCVTPEVRVCQ